MTEVIQTTCHGVSEDTSSNNSMSNLVRSEGGGKVRCHAEGVAPST